MRQIPALALAGALCAGAISVPGVAHAQHEPAYAVTGGTVDQATYNGYRRYTESCLRCHGPDGAGSSYAPDLTNSLKSLDYEHFAETIINGKKNVSSASNNVMPAFGTVEDVALYLDDIYGYLKARSDGQIGRGRPRRAGEDQN